MVQVIYLLTIQGFSQKKKKKKKPFKEEKGNHVTSGRVRILGWGEYQKRVKLIRKIIN